MTPEQLFQQIHSLCISNTNEEIVKKYSRYFKDGYIGYGVSREIFLPMTDELAVNPEVTLDLVLDTAPALLSTGMYEETVILIILTLKYKKEFTLKTFRSMETWFGYGISNWAHTDFFCGEVMDLFFRKGIVKMDDLSAWRNAGNKFQRRAVPVSLIKPMKREGNPLPYLPFLAPMMLDPEREVHQGLGWFLREAWKKQNEPVEQFLLKFKNTAPRLIFQYATEKMTAEGKARFRRGK
jgi:3-methyladenine DNA glycosylase AlkD